MSPTLRKVRARPPARYDDYEDGNNVDSARKRHRSREEKPRCALHFPQLKAAVSAPLSAAALSPLCLTQRLLPPMFATVAPSISHSATKETPDPFQLAEKVHASEGGWQDEEVQRFMQSAKVAYFECYTLARIKLLLNSSIADQALRDVLVKQVEAQEDRLIAQGRAAQPDSRADEEAAAAEAAAVAEAVTPAEGDLQVKRLSFWHSCERSFSLCGSMSCRFCAPLADDPLKHGCGTPFRDVYYVVRTKFGQDKIHGALLQPYCKAPLQVQLEGTNNKPVAAAEAMRVQVVVLKPEYDQGAGDDFAEYVDEMWTSLLHNNEATLPAGKSTVALPRSLHLEDYAAAKPRLEREGFDVNTAAGKKDQKSRSDFRLGVRVLLSDGTAAPGVRPACSQSTFKIQTLRSAADQKPEKLLKSDSIKRAKKIGPVALDGVLKAMLESDTLRKQRKVALRGKKGVASVTVGDFLKAVKADRKTLQANSGLADAAFAEIVRQCEGHVEERPLPRVYTRWEKGAKPLAKKSVPEAALLFDDRHFPFALVHRGPKNSKAWGLTVQVEQIECGSVLGVLFDSMHTEAVAQWRKPGHPGWSTLGFCAEGEAPPAVWTDKQLCEAVNLASAIKKGLSEGEPLEQLEESLGGEEADNCYENGVGCSQGVDALGLYAPLGELAPASLQAEEDLRPLCAMGAGSLEDPPPSQQGLLSEMLDDNGAAGLRVPRETPAVVAQASRGEEFSMQWGDLDAMALAGEFGDDLSEIVGEMAELQQHGAAVSAGQPVSSAPTLAPAMALPEASDGARQTAMHSVDEQADADADPDEIASKLAEVAAKAVPGARPEASAEAKRLRFFMRVHLRFRVMSWWGQLSGQSGVAFDVWRRRAAHSGAARGPLARALAKATRDADDRFPKRRQAAEGSGAIAAVPLFASQQNPNDYEMCPELRAQGGASGGGDDEGTAAQFDGLLSCPI